MKKLVSESLQEYTSLNESVGGIILTSLGLYFIYKFFKSILQTPQQEMDKLEKGIIKDSMWLIRNRIKHPHTIKDRDPISYSSDEWFHIITVPKDNNNIYTYKINKKTKNMFVIAPSGNAKDHAFKLTDKQFDKFEELINKIKEEK